MTGPIDCCSAGDVSAVATADVDGDGATDIIAATKDQGIGWYPNRLTSFSSRRTITSSNEDQAVWIDAADLDGDGDQDIVGASLATSQLFWYPNVGGGNFGAKRTATPTLVGGISVELSDVDGDSDIDIVWGSVSQNAVVWNANNGQGTFGSPQLIQTGFPSAQDTVIADINGDGHEDVVAASLDFVNPRVSWFENSGNGSFGEEQQAVADGNGVWAVDAGDVDGDGDLDLVTSLYSIISGAQTIQWAENLDGQGTFAPQRPVLNQTRFAMDIRLVDIDGDSDLDVLGVPLVGNGSPIVVPNDGGGQFGESMTIDAQGALRFALADFDKDGQVEIATNSQSGLLRAEFDASPPRILGDANGDGIFNSSDIVVVFTAGKYETGAAATFEQGDWNGDGIFGTADLVAAFTAGGYVARSRPAAVDARETENTTVDDSRDADVDIAAPLTNTQLAAAIDLLFEDTRSTKQ